MRRGMQILGLGLFMAVVAYACFYFAGTARSRELLRNPQPELAWLKAEYRLGDEEFARLSELHNGYLPKCAERCRTIGELNAKLEQRLATSSEMTAEMKMLLEERARMRAICQAEMLEHFFQVSQTMPPAQGKRYLAWVQAQAFLREPAMVHHPENEPANAHQHH